jgi:hypothetical protein
MSGHPSGRMSEKMMSGHRINPGIIEALGLGIPMSGLEIPIPICF